MVLERVIKPWLMFESIFKMTNSSEREIKQKMSLHQYTMKVRKVYRSY